MKLKASAEGVLTDIGYLQHSEFGMMFFARKDEAVGERFTPAREWD